MNTAVTTSYVELSELEISADSRQLVDRVVEASADLLEVSPPLVRWFVPADGRPGREIAFEDPDPLYGRALPGVGQIWLHAGLTENKRELVLTAAHEVAHIAGYKGEAPAEEFALRLQAIAAESSAEDSAPSTLDEFLNQLTLLTGVTATTAAEAERDAEYIAKAATKERVDRIENLAYAIKKARRQAIVLYPEWRETQRRGTFELWLAADRSARAWFEELRELLLYDDALVGDLLDRAGAARRWPTAV